MQIDKINTTNEINETNEINQEQKIIYQCPICSYCDEKLLSLSVHFRGQYHKTSKELYILLFCNGVEPTCACGCGNKVKFHSIAVGFSQFCPGHQSRVNNNWGHNKKCLLKSQEVRRQMHKNHEIKIWNKGLTKETDERLAEYGRKGSETINSNPELLLLRSERMRENRLNGTIPTLRGEDHSQWKGGTSSLQALVRSHLHKVWTYPKFKNADFCCEQCNHSSSDGVILNVHHNGETFSEILQKAIKHYDEQKVEYDDIQYKALVCDWVCQYHIDNNVSGIVLCEDCHKKIHSHA